MMNIAYCSDLHLEFELSSKRSNIPRLLKSGISNKCGAKVLILAGDVVCTEFIKHGFVDTFFELLSQEYEYILYVFGNHEYYKGFFLESVETVRNYLKRWQNIHVLDGNSIEIDGILFFGSTLWTSFRNDDPNVMLTAKQCLSDYHHIWVDSENYYLLSPEDVSNKHKQDLSILKNTLSQNKPTVVISHHAPSLCSIDSIYKISTRSMNLNYCYYSELDYLCYDYENLNFWVHGHCHNKSDYMINNTRVICNPRGYIGQERIATQFELKLFAINK